MLLNERKHFFLDQSLGYTATSDMKQQRMTANSLTMGSGLGLKGWPKISLIFTELSTRVRVGLNQSISLALFLTCKKINNC